MCSIASSALDGRHSTGSRNRAITQERVLGSLEARSRPSAGAPTTRVVRGGVEARRGRRGSAELDGAEASPTIVVVMARRVIAACSLLKHGRKPPTLGAATNVNARTCSRSTLSSRDSASP